MLIFSFYLSLHLCEIIFHQFLMVDIDRYGRNQHIFCRMCCIGLCRIANTRNVSLLLNTQPWNCVHKTSFVAPDVIVGVVVMSWGFPSETFSTGFKRFWREICISRLRSENRWRFVFHYAEIVCTSSSIPRQRPLREIGCIIRFLIRRNTQCYNHDDRVLFFSHTFGNVSFEDRSRS